VTTAYTDLGDVVAAEEVYAAQQDSQLLIEVMAETGLAAGRRVADLCTGSGEQATLNALNNAGLHADVVVQQSIPFGPVLTARAAWLESIGLLWPGRREEKLFVIRAEKP
jgi:hypothetical protein